MEFLGCVFVITTLVALAMDLVSAIVLAFRRYYQEGTKMTLVLVGIAIVNLIVIIIYIANRMAITP